MILRLGMMGLALAIIWRPELSFEISKTSLCTIFLSGYWPAYITDSFTERNPVKFSTSWRLFLFSSVLPSAGWGDRPPHCPHEMKKCRKLSSLLASLTPSNFARLSPLSLSGKTCNMPFLTLILRRRAWRDTIPILGCPLSVRAKPDATQR